MKIERLKVDLDQMIPIHMHQPILDWIWNGFPQGSFLMAVLENNLKEASIRADALNSRFLANYGKILCWHFPLDSYGSQEKISKWEAMGGWNGMLKKDSN